MLILLKVGFWILVEGLEHIPLLKLCVQMLPKFSTLDVNPINCDFVLERSEKLGGYLTKFKSHQNLKLNSFYTIMCFDVMEHLPDPISQLIEFHKLLSSDGKLLINWYFSKDFANEYPFHLDNTAIVKYFFQTLQSHFLEGSISLPFNNNQML